MADGCYLRSVRLGSNVRRSSAVEIQGVVTQASQGLAKQVANVFRFIDVPFEEARPGSTVIIAINNRDQLIGFYAETFGRIFGVRAE